MYPARVGTSPSTPPRTPAGDAISSRTFIRVTEMLQYGVEHGVYPGAVLLIGHHGQVLYHYAVGKKWVQPPEEIRNEMTRDTVFDVAGLTSLVVTTSILMHFVEKGKVCLDDRVSRYLQAFGVVGKQPITIEHLLAHSSGLPHWLPYCEDLVRLNAGERIGILTSRGARDYICNDINRLDLKYPPGTKQLYSDLGLILLGNLIEQLTGLQLDKAAQKFVWQPLNMRNSSYIDIAMIKRRGILPVKDRIAPTEECSWRKRVLCGEVSDDNAWAMGGIAGHAGLFTDATDLHIFASELLKAYRGSSTFLKRETVRRFFAGPSSFEASAGMRLGWESPNRDNCMLEAKLSEHAVGHCGFTGCSLWLEPEHGLDVVFLTNRVHPSKNNKQIRTFRPELHATIIESLGGQ